MSKHVVNTGDGYCGVYRVSNGTTTISLATNQHVDWDRGDVVYSTEVDDGVALIPEEPEYWISKYRVKNSGDGEDVSISGQTLRILGIGHGDDVRVYARGENSLTIVPAADDPMVATDGGQEQTRIDPCCVDEHGSPQFMTDGGQDVQHHPDGFHSGDHHILTDPPRQEPDPGDPMNWCYECGDRATSRCHCGMPLCGRHAETQAGYCSDFVTIQTRVGSVPACVRTVDDETEIVVDVGAFNLERPDDNRLDRDDLEDAVRERLPAALIDKAADATSDARTAARDGRDADVFKAAGSIDDAIAFAQVSSGRRRHTWLRCAYLQIEKVLEEVDADDLGVGLDLSMAKGYLEQLGVHRDDQGGAETHE